MAWATGGVIVLVCMAVSDILPRWRPGVLAALLVGQAPLAALLTRRTLTQSPATNWSPVDLLTAFLVPWSGPIFWHRASKRAQENPELLVAHAAEWDSQRDRVLWICIAALLAASVLLVIRSGLR